MEYYIFLNKMTPQPTESQPVAKRTRAATKWREWKNLPTDLVEDIAGRLLNFDVAEYLCFRATCKPWRDCTDNPRMGDGMDARFRPRNWIVLNRCGARTGRTLVNIATGARTSIDFHELFTHHQLGTADGLLVLANKATDHICLLNPLTRAFGGFPPLRIDRAVNMSSMICGSSSSSSSRPPLDPSKINGAGIDDSTSPRTLVLCLRAGWCPIVCAKPGDNNWVYGCATEMRPAGIVTRVQSPVTIGGRCYFTTVAGAIMTVDPSSPARWPVMTFLLNEDPPVNAKISSFLVRSQGRMLMVRYMVGFNLVDGGGYDETKIFKWHGRPCCMEVFEVDIAGRRLVPQSGVGDNKAAFLGATHTVMVSTKKFPKIADNSVYLNCFLQRRGHFGAYHFGDRTTTPPKDFPARGSRRYFPCACHWELEDCLVRNVEKRYYKENYLYMDDDMRQDAP
ncbi:hypothetical protein QYE76_008733 [Lolium multiflorum]|uniref:KIB1-4 beta-propeller domain-containing protein n=1 Tax=Lolium multiflorum TaxID=4521 RepID=A0AAD8TRT6_LOLMU|nr:hypothetical protein QYE76_008733 [Lolium multiflorum]